jgi:nucleoside-diphosphate-sugar epimerase
MNKTEIVKNHQSVLVIGSGYLANIVRKYSKYECYFYSPSGNLIGANQDCLTTLDENFFDNVQPSAIVWVSGPGFAGVNFQELDATKSRSIDLSLRLAKITNGRTPIYFFSSGGAVYGGQYTDSIVETDELRGATPYALYNIEMESHIMRAWGKENVTIFRLSNCCGPLQLDKVGQGFLTHTIVNAIRNAPITIFGSGNTIRDYINESEVVLMLDRALEKGVHGIFNLGTGIGISQNTIIEVVADILNKDVEVLWAPARNFDIPYNVLNSDKLAKCIGFEKASAIKFFLPNMVAKISEVLHINLNEKK